MTLTLLVAFAATNVAFAQNEDPGLDPETSEAAEEVFSSDSKNLHDLSKPTEIGVRFTPAIAEAITSRMTEQMKQRYDLKDEQVERIRKAVQKNMMELAHDNAEMGQDLIETMMASMISNEGSFKKDDAVEFGKKMAPFIPKLRGFFTDSAGDIGQIMTLKQRLRFTADMTALTAGLTIFEERMKKWEGGEVKDGANPFFDRQMLGEEEEDENSDEPAEIRRARRRVEQRLQWELNYDREWQQYVTNATIYYDFDEKQQTAANGILEDCKSRAKQIQSEDWWTKVKQNRIAQQLSWSMDSKFREGPLGYQLDAAYLKLKEPIEDISKDLKRRIERIPTTKQRLAARRATEEIMREKGLESLPM